MIVGVLNERGQIVVAPSAICGSEDRGRRGLTPRRVHDLSEPAIDSVAVLVADSVSVGHADAYETVFSARYFAANRTERLTAEGIKGV